VRNGISWDVRQAVEDLRSIAKNAPDEIAAAQMAETEIEATEAQRQTPVDLGPLRASVHAEGPEWHGNVCETSIVAGGPSADYAIYVHEDLDAYHPVGNAKFIERPLFEALPFMAKRIANRIDVNRMMK
jgi:hypothetical protein